MHARGGLRHRPCGSHGRGVGGNRRAAHGEGDADDRRREAGQVHAARRSRRIVEHDGLHASLRGSGRSGRRWRQGALHGLRRQQPERGLRRRGAEGHAALHVHLLVAVQARNGDARAWTVRAPDRRRHRCLREGEGRAPLRRSAVRLRREDDLPRDGGARQGAVGGSHGAGEHACVADVERDAVVARRMRQLTRSC